MERVIIDGYTIYYEIKSNKRAKKVRITVDKDFVKVSIPQGVKKDHAKRFVEEKKEWILKKIQEFVQNKKVYSAGEKFLLRGKEYTLKTRVANINAVQVELEGDTLWSIIPLKLDEKSYPQSIKEGLIKWYKKEAKNILQERLNYFSEIMGLHYNQLRIKDQKTRWGSCSNKKNINLNWKIILAPDNIINYLIIHELAHLKHMNHSQEYWQFMEMFKPDYLACRKWLRDNGKFLYI